MFFVADDEEILREFFQTDAASSQLSSFSSQYQYNPKHESKFEVSQSDWNSMNGSVIDFLNTDAFNLNSPVKSAITHQINHSIISTPQSIESSSIISDAPAYRSSLSINTHHKFSDSGMDLSSSSNRASYKKVKGKSSQRCRRFPPFLPDDKNRKKTQQSGKEQLWFFILNHLNDFTKKSIIIWTGIQRKFKIRNVEMFCHLWSKHNGKNTDFQWESLRRTMRNCGSNGLLMAVPSNNKIHKGRNEKGIFGFVIEVSSYLKITREELDRLISLHCETGPLTVGSPIDSSFG